MNLQSIMWPKVGVCTCEELYFRISEKVKRNEQGYLNFYKNGVAWFDTYFNSVSVGKWLKYTKVEKFGLRLKLQGAFRITLYQKIKVHGIIAEQALKEEVFMSERKLSIEIQCPEILKGMLFFRLEALKADSVFYGGEYITYLPESIRRDIKLGIVICTFRREEFIKRNIEILNQYLLNNEDSPVRDKLEVFISDNGKTLPIEELKTEKIHIFPNKNVGGSGGFTRGLIEIMNVNPRAGVTHALLMDDDIVIAPESIIRTWQILSLVKDEYQEAFIGGAMLRMDQPSIQVEAGASWNGGRLISLKSGLDLCHVDACLYNEVEEYAEFNAWWYCCFPMSIVREDNLPLPLFIRGDDVEYGLRNMKQLILMNGICVWHEPFENKYSSFLNYYIIRNQLIDNALHCPEYGKKQLKKELFRRVTEEILFYRYKNVDLILRGVEDFLKGPEWLLQTDGELLHKEIMTAGYKAVPVEKLDMAFSYSEYDMSLRQIESRMHRWIRKFSFNGYVIKANKQRIVSMFNPKFCNIWRAKKVMYYDTVTEKGFIESKKLRSALQCYIKLVRCNRKIDGLFKISIENYEEKVQELRKKDFWKKYLEY